MSSPVFAKLNLKDHDTLVVLNAPASFESELRKLKGVEVRRELKGLSLFTLAFVTTQRQVDTLGKAVAKAAQGDAIVWFAYPKGSSKRYTCEINRDSGWQVLGDAGFEPVRMVAIDEDWSAVRFRRAEFIKTMTRREDVPISKARPSDRERHGAARRSCRCCRVAADARSAVARRRGVRCFHRRLTAAAVCGTRIATPADADAIASLHLDSIRTIGPRFYAADVVDAWASAVTPALYVSAMAAGEVFFVALESGDDKRLVGFSSHLVTDGVHGVSVYVRGSVERRGVGSTLLRLAEARAAAEGAREIEILASLPGLPFYSRHGFHAVGPRDVTFGSRVVPCIAMRKTLAPRS